MSNKVAWLLLLALVCENHCGHGEEVDCSKEPKCPVFPSHGLRAADCFEKNFYSFPKCVATDVEVMELTRNRIRTFTNSDLTRYGYIKLLYLTDNLISKLDDETFKNLDSLRKLDLSMNALFKVPLTVFHLPSLKILVLRQNQDLDINAALEQTKPISSPLTVLDISLTSSRHFSPDFPDFGLLPFLTTLNVTGNYYDSIAPKYFAGLCNLNRLINNGTIVGFGDVCDCWTINRWLGERRVEFSPFECPVPENSCLDKTLSEEDKKTYEQCKETYSKIQTANTWRKAGIGIGIAVSVIAVISCICFLCIRKKRREKRAKKGLENSRNQIDSSTLLNNDPKNNLPNN